MSWRTVVVATRAKLDLQLGYLVVRGEQIKKVHLGEIGVLVIENTQVSITAALLAELVRRKIVVIFCDEKRNPAAELLAYYGSHDTSRKVREQIAWSGIIKKSIWTEIVRAKIKIQQNLLILLKKEKEAEMLAGYLRELTINDETNREGHAAKVYFNALFGMEFTRSEIIPLNAALNYGYAILLSACNRAIVSDGYITQLGLHHENTFNAFNLGSDLMEPLRPFVDRIVYALWQNSELNCFGTEEKHKVIPVINSPVLFDEKKHVLSHAIGLYCKSIFAAIRDEDISLIKLCHFDKTGEEK